MTGSGRESAILIAVPEAEPVVGALRAEHDPAAAAGVPAHVTLLYPFVPAEVVDEEVLERVRDVVAACPVFRFALEEVGWFDGGVLYLAPSPDEPFVRLIAGLAERFPAYPPYGGAYELVVPHLTVATNGSPEMERSLTSALPVNSVASEVLLMEEGADATWSVRARFPLGMPG